VCAIKSVLLALFEACDKFNDSVMDWKELRVCGALIVCFAVGSRKVNLWRNQKVICGLGCVKIGDCLKGTRKKHSIFWIATNQSSNSHYLKQV
jgi:hypothetical protein